MPNTETVKAPENFWDKIEAALWICDAEDVEPIDTCAKIHTQGAHGTSATEGLIITTTEGKRYKLTAEELV